MQTSKLKSKPQEKVFNTGTVASNLVTFRDFFARIIFASNCFYGRLLKTDLNIKVIPVAHVIRDETLFTGSKIDPKSKAQSQRFRGHP